MNMLLIESTFVVASAAPGKNFISTVVCFEDCFYIVLHVESYSFGVDQNPVSSYNFEDDHVAKGVQKIIDLCTTEDELRARLQELIQHNMRCVVYFSDFKKAKISGFLGIKTLKVSNNMMS